jgi:hypothetical protein
MINKTRTIDKRQRVGTVCPTKVKSSRNVITEPIKLTWVEPEHLIKLFSNFAKEVDRLKNQRRNRLKKQGYKGIELTNAYLHFWAINNYNARKELERIDNNRQIISFKVTKTGVHKINIDLNHVHREVTPELVNLQTVLNAKRLSDYKEDRDRREKEKSHKIIADFYDSERKKLIGFKPLDNTNKLTLKIDDFDFDFDF